MPKCVAHAVKISAARGSAADYAVRTLEKSGGFACFPLTC